jgi:hypothetical protein
MVTRLRVGPSGFRTEAGEKVLSTLQESRPALWTTQASVQRYRASDAEGKRHDHEINHPSPSSDKVENEWSCTFTPAVCLSGVDKDTFTFCTFHSVTVA